jgi:hypothetical protein
VRQGEQEKAIAGGVDPKVVTIADPEDRSALGRGFADVQGVDPISLWADLLTEDDDGERWLAPMVVEQEFHA